MNQTPDQNRNQYSDQQNRAPRNMGADQNAGRNTYPQRQGNGGNNPGSGMTPEEREEYLRRLEARRRAQERRGGSRSGYRRRKRVGINIGITIFLVLICLVLGFSFYQIFQNGNPSSENKDPLPNVQETGDAAESDDPAEMISTMGDGLYAAKMGGGSVNPATGEFNFAVNEGYLVKDGKITTPVRGASLIGKGNEILMQIDRVGRTMHMAQGMCGSMSGSVPTNVGQPFIRVKSIIVGGRA